MNRYISDLHFGHKNILAYDNRPFQSIEEHDEFLIKKWNETVADDDIVYILGDISWHNVTKTVEILRSLKGKKVLVSGNHDGELIGKQIFADEFSRIAPYMEIKDRGRFVVLCHYPILTFNNQFNANAHHLYGHTHTSFDDNIINHAKSTMASLYLKPEHQMYNVGAMKPYINYRPKTLDEIIRNHNE